MKKRTRPAFGPVEDGYVHSREIASRGPVIRPEAQASYAGELAYFLETKLREATKQDTYLTVRDLSTAWFDRKGFADIKPRELAQRGKRIWTWLSKNEGIFTERLEGFAIRRGKAAAGWRWKGRREVSPS